jgi:hypothetical protein
MTRIASAIRVPDMTRIASHGVIRVPDMTRIASVILSEFSSWGSSPGQLLVATTKSPGIQARPVCVGPRLRRQTRLPSMDDLGSQAVLGLLA